MSTAAKSPTESMESDRCSAQQMAASLPRRYLAVLASVALLLILDQAVIQPLLLQVSLYAPTINVAGRQRMLSQRLTKAALVMQAFDQESEFRRSREELGDALSQWTRAHHGLLHGDASLNLPPTTQPEIQQQFARLTPHFEQMARSARLLQTMAAPGGDAERAALNQQVAAMLRHESAYLPTMDRIVGLYEQEARRQVLVLRLSGLAVTVSVILLMVALAYLVLRPANRTILEQVQQLEDRVAQRTSQLTESNQALTREIHERRQAEHRTRQLSDQLAHASRVTAMGQLATGLAHEINQPLAAIANYAESCAVFLRSDPIERAEAQGAVQRIRDAALRAGGIVRRMRNFVRPQPLQDGAAQPRVDVNALIREVAALCQAEVAGADVMMQLDLSSDLRDVHVDPIQIQQVLVNLIQNSVQALRSNPRDGRSLTIRTNGDDDTVQIQVADNGPGFAAADLESVFAPFFTTRKDGLGVGLAISRGIVEQHQGRLWAESRPAGGAVVCFTLPTRQKDGTRVEHDAHCLCG
ncbi:MAG: ATP-binding protein [Pirellulaceae bacterium]